jgi:hypothetical protein
VERGVNVAAPNVYVIRERPQRIALAATHFAQNRTWDEIRFFTQIRALVLIPVSTLAQAYYCSLWPFSYYLDYGPEGFSSASTELLA